MKIVFVHGFLGSAMNWGPIFNRLKEHPLSRDWEPLAYEMPGHGRRGLEPLPRPLTLDDVTKDFAAWAPTGNFVAVGHSFGLRPLLKFTALSPGRVTQLVAEDTSPVLSGPGFEELTGIFDGIPTPFASREEARIELDLRFGTGSQMSKFLLSNIRETAPDVHDWRFQKEPLKELLFEAKSRGLWTEWENYPGPLHMILGADSKHVPPARVEECLKRRPGKVTNVVRIEGAGHWVHSNQPALFVESLINLVNRGLNT